MFNLRRKGKDQSTLTFQSLAISIQDELDTLPQVSQSCCIYKISKLLRELNEQAYTPAVVSIGPFHHNNERLLSMETHKVKYLQSFLYYSQINADLPSYLQLIKDKEAQIRDSYVEPIRLPSDDFIRMVLIDSAFIIELFRTYSIITPFTLAELIHDLRLAENQLPFFILKDLYSAAFKANHINTNATYFTDIACAWLGVNKGRVEIDASTNEAASCCHLLDLLRSHHLPSRQIMDAESDGANNIVKRSIVCPTATSLYEAGVKLRFVDVDSTSSGPSLLDIHFDEGSGILTIPKLRVHDPTESLFRNMIAFEQCHYADRTYLAHYHFFMDCLINSWEDVQLLAKAGVIENLLGNEKDVSDLINTLGTHVSSVRCLYYYGCITDQLIVHCNKRWNRYRATLKHTYFRHPWAVLSVIYAFILLVLTLVQVVAGILAVPSVMY